MNKHNCLTCDWAHWFPKNPKKMFYQSDLGECTYPLPACKTYDNNGEAKTDLKVDFPEEDCECWKMRKVVNP